MAKTLHFRSAKTYKNWLRSKFYFAPKSHGRKRVLIAGRPHKVNHARG